MSPEPGFGRIVGLLLLVGCGANPTSTEEARFPDEAFQQFVGTKGALSFELRSAPQPPLRGLATFQLRVTDERGPVEHLQIAVQPWMPLMGHGTAVVPTVTERGGGLYEVSNVYLFMAGLWELRTEIQGEVTDHVAPQFEIH